MQWQKKGLLVPKAPGQYSHASHPTAICIQENLFLIAFSGRNKEQRSHIFLVLAHFDDGEVRITSDPVLAMQPGAPGTFDCDGLLSCNFVWDGPNLYLYYCGWQNLPNRMWHCDTGRLLVDVNNLRLQREFLGPIMGRSIDVPLYAVATVVRKISDNSWISWYNRGLSWNYDGKEWIPKYGIHLAHSSDGVKWKCGDELVIPFLDASEHSFGRPTVLVYQGKYYMWFAARGAFGNTTYRIGFATSENGENWIRRDDLSGIDVSPSGWDSDAVCYPFVLQHKEHLYLLYNGNNYGISGFGYAVTHKNNLVNLFLNSNK